MTGRHIIGTLLLILPLLLTAALVPQATHAADPFFVQSAPRKVYVDPADSSLWVLWHDNTTFAQQKANLSHYSAAGRLLQNQLVAYKGGVAGSTEQVVMANFVQLPGKSLRFYSLTTTSTTDNATADVITSLSYIELATGQLVNIASNVSLPKCSSSHNHNSALGQFIYNPALQHLYVECGIYSNSKSANWALVIDTTIDKVTAVLPYAPLAVNPVTGWLYALNYPTLNNTNVAEFELITLNGKTEQPTADAPLISKQSALYSSLSSLLIHSKTGQIYTTISTYRQASVGRVFDKDNQLVPSQSGTPANYYSLLNEATNQLYGEGVFNWARSGTIAVDANNIPNGQQAWLTTWQPLAVDNINNWVYVYDPSYNYGAAANGDKGLGLLVMDGRNYDIIKSVTIRAPDVYYASKISRLAGPPPGFQGRFYPATGHTLSGKFLEYWDSHGGLANFGYPISEPFEELNWTVQYFERARFELHPENAGTPYEVLLGFLGRFFSAQTGPIVEGVFVSGETTPISGGVLFKQTRHTLTGKFLAYWQANGGLAQFGLPITEPTNEVSPIDGQTYQVQYFERARFELHPENAGTPHEVLLGLLGTQLLRFRGWSL